MRTLSIPDDVVPSVSQLEHGSAWVLRALAADDRVLICSGKGEDWRLGLASAVLMRMGYELSDALFLVRACRERRRAFPATGRDPQRARGPRRSRPDLVSAVTTNGRHGLDVPPRYSALGERPTEHSIRPVDDATDRRPRTGAPGNTESTERITPESVEATEPGTSGSGQVVPSALMLFGLTAAAVGLAIMAITALASLSIFDSGEMARSVTEMDVDEALGDDIPEPTPPAEPTEEPAPLTATSNLSRQAVTVGPSPERTPRASLEIAPQPTAASTSTSRIVFSDTFDQSQGGWPNDAQGTAWLTPGAYRLFARQPSRFVAVAAPVALPLRDIVVTGTFRKTGGPPGGGYGLIVRDQSSAARDGKAQDGRYYVLEVGDLGQVGVWRREEDRWVDLLPWAASPAVRPGEAQNELTARAVGQRLTLLVNGVEVVSLEDGALAEGGVGIFVGGDHNQVAVERLIVETLN